MLEKANPAVDDGKAAPHSSQCSLTLFNLFLGPTVPDLTLSEEKHIKDSCRKRQVKCTSCDHSYDANSEEEHQKECPARLVPCRLCGEEVRLRDMEAHLSRNPGRHFQLMFGLLDKVASLEAEVKKLKGEA